MGQWIYGQYTEEEERAYECFEKFAEKHPDSFQDYEQTEYGHFFDVWALNKNNQPEQVELKLRAEGADHYGDCFIEPKKWNNMLSEYRTGTNHMKPVYINFIGDEKEVYLWQLEKIKNAKFHPNITIDGEEQDRIGLNWNDAWHYSYNAEDGTYKLVNKGK